jgi:Uma2 family endonuclease
MTVDAYLALEEISDRKHEYVGGELYALAGASEPHILIVTNLTVEAAVAARRAGQCRVLGSDMRLRVKTDVYYYPDLMVICDPSDTDPGDKTRPCIVLKSARLPPRLLIIVRSCWPIGASRPYGHM